MTHSDRKLRLKLALIMALMVGYRLQQQFISNKKPPFSKGCKDA